MTVEKDSELGNGERPDQVHPQDMVEGLEDVLCMVVNFGEIDIHQNGAVVGGMKCPLHLKE